MGETVWHIGMVVVLLLVATVAIPVAGLMTWRVCEWLDRKRS